VNQKHICLSSNVIIVKKLDDDTRGFIEKEIDRLMKDEWDLDKIKWIPKTIPITSLHEVALGCVLGRIMRFSREILLQISGAEPIVEDEREIQDMLKRRIPEIMERITLELSR
jgi:hypothetical protein